jgi:hypothetical protein
MKARYAKQIRAGILASREPRMPCTEHLHCDETLLDFVALRHNLIAYEVAYAGPNCLAERAYFRAQPRNRYNHSEGNR